MEENHGFGDVPPEEVQQEEDHLAEEPPPEENVLGPEVTCLGETNMGAIQQEVIRP